MSFSFGVSDILALSKLAHDIWSRVHDSPGQFKAIRNEFRGLYIILDDVGQRLPGSRLNEEQKAHLISLTRASKDVLDDTNDILEKFARLGVSSSGLRNMARKTFKKITWDEERIRDLRGRMVSNTTLLNTFITSLTSNTTQSMNDEVTSLVGRVQGLQRQNEDQERRKILDSISAMNYTTKQSMILDQRQEGTGQWLLDSKEFQEWMRNSGGTLLCTGMPGAGKTMLTSIAIEHLNDTFGSQQDIGVAYIYCDYKIGNEQRPLNLLASLLKQLLIQKSSIPEHIQELYRQYSDRAETPRPSLKEVFESLQLTVASFSQVYIIVDALDELQQGDQVVQAFLSRLSELKAKKSVKYMLTSRVVPRVMDCIQSGLRLEIRASKEDVMRYIDARMNELPKFVSKKPELQKTIKEVIVAAVDGMFLLARLHLESLVDKMSPTEVRMALESLPKGNEALSIAYDQAMRRIETQKPGMRLIAQKALGWITYAKRPLSVDELRYAIAVQPGHSHFNEEDLSDIDDIVSACGGLVTVDRGHDTQTARLVHYTTQQFLMRTGETYFPNAREISAVNSLTYLLYNDFERGWLLESKDKIFNQGRFVQERVLQHPFLCYAARYWAAHASECTAQSVVDLSLRFLSDDFRVSSATQILFARIVNKYAADGFLGWGLNSQARNPVSGLHLAVYFGFNDMVLKLLDHGFKADSRDGAQRSPLFWAAQMGHAKIVALLLSFNYGEVVRKGRKEQTGAASKLLPTVNSVDVNCRDIIGNTPLTVSTSYGHVGVVVQLLEQADISPNLAPENGCTPLTYAARRGDAAILRLLVAHADIDINVFPPGGRTALTWAIRGSSKDLVSILLSHANIDVNLEDSGGQTPLIAAISQNNEEIVKLLLAHPRMDVSCSSRDGITALTVATICGYKPIEKLLMACTRYNWNSTLGYTSHAGYEWLSERGHLVEAQMSFKLHTETRSRLVRKLGKEPHDEVDFLQHQAIIELLQERTDDDIHFIGEEGNKLLSRVAQYSQEISEPRLERVTALLNTAVEDRSRAIPDWVPNSQNGPFKEQHESQKGHSNNLQTAPHFPSSNLIPIRLKRPSVGFEPSESLVQKNKYDQGAVLR